MNEDIWNEDTIWEDEKPEELTEENVVIEQERDTFFDDEDDEWFANLMQEEEGNEVVENLKSDPYLSSWIPAKPQSVNANAKYAYNYLSEKGLPQHVAAGIVGNLMKESGLNPTVRDGDKRGGIGGIAQWDPERSQGLMNFSRQRSSSPQDLNTQLDFVLHEAQQRGDLDKTMRAKTPEEAAVIFGRSYERPNERYADWGTRQGYARSLTKKYGGSSNVDLIPEDYLYGISDEAVQQYLQDENVDTQEVLENTESNTTIGQVGQIALQTIETVNDFKEKMRQVGLNAAKHTSQIIDTANETAGFTRNQVSLRKFNDFKNEKKYQLNRTNTNSPLIYS